MNISDAKKVMLDKVNLEIEETALSEELKEKEKQINKLENEVEELQREYDSLVNSGIRQFFLGLAGKKESSLQESQNQVRMKTAELSAVKFETESLQAKLEDISQTKSEIESTCNACLEIIAEADGNEMKRKLLSITEVDKLITEVTSSIKEAKPLFTTAYDIYAAPRMSRTTTGGSNVSAFYNKDLEMKKQSKLIEKQMNHIIELLNAYNMYVPDEIKIDFHGKWMEKENYWEDQQMDYDTMERIKKVDEWCYYLEANWKVMRKQQKATMKKVEEEVLAYLDN